MESTMFEPEKPCRVLPTRGCPILRAAGCPGDPCARYESEDETPWAADIEVWKAERKAAHIPAAAYVEPAHAFHYGSDDDRARAEDWVDECLSFGPGGGFLYLADLGPHDFLYVLPTYTSDRESQR